MFRRVRAPIVWLAALLAVGLTVVAPTCPALAAATYTDASEEEKSPAEKDLDDTLKLSRSDHKPQTLPARVVTRLPHDPSRPTVSRPIISSPSADALNNGLSAHYRC
jgi:hypothetical protein